MTFKTRDIIETVSHPPSIIFQPMKQTVVIKLSLSDIGTIHVLFTLKACSNKTLTQNK